MSRSRVTGWKPQELFMKAMDCRRIGMCLLIVGGSVLATGCGKNLFSESSRDSSRRSKIEKYYGGDSAIETTAGRRKSGDMGFGYPSGMGPN
jgi:hypothetical protein